MYMPSCIDKQVGWEVHVGIRRNGNLVHTHNGAAQVGAVFAKGVRRQIHPVVRHRASGQ